MKRVAEAGSQASVSVSVSVSGSHRLLQMQSSWCVEIRIMAMSEAAVVMARDESRFDETELPDQDKEWFQHVVAGDMAGG